MDPIQTFQHEVISVLTDHSYFEGQVFLEIAGRLRVFGNVWALNDCIIFKGSFPLIGAFNGPFCFFSLSDTLLDIRGKLEGENVVAAAIPGVPNLWCFVGLWPELVPAPYMTTTQITSAEGALIQDWRELIRQMLRSPGINIHITDTPWAGHDARTLHCSPQASWSGQYTISMTRAPRWSPTSVLHQAAFNGL